MEKREKLENGNFSWLLEIENEGRRKLLRYIKDKYDVKESSLEYKLRIELTPYLSDP